MIVEHYGSDQSCLTAVLDMLNCYDYLSTKKVGIINWWWLDNNQADFDQLKSFIERQDICFFLSEEIYYKYNSVDVNSLFALLNLHNVYYILFSEDSTLTVKPNNNKAFFCPWFLKSPLFVSSNFGSDLAYKEKPYVFNLMLGSKKSYRTIAYKMLRDDKNIYSTYLGHPLYKQESDTFFDEEDVRNDLLKQDVFVNKLNTMNSILREGRRHTLSHVVPDKIYANTHFDIVTETFVKQGHHFLTEKTAKPLATGRFFCWYASYGVMSYLERYGFDFMHYQSEYDKIANDVDRLDELISVIQEISSDNLLVKDIYEKSEHVRIHNKHVYWNLRNRFYDDLTNWMFECLQK